MVYTVQVACPQGESCDTIWPWLGNYSHNIGHSPLSIAYQIERFGSGILSPIASQSPFTGNAGMQYHVRGIEVNLPKRRPACVLTIRFKHKIPSY